MIRVLRAATLLSLAVAAVYVGWSVWRPSLQLDRLGQIGPFSFQSRDGKSVSNAELRGKVCVFACFFTCCTETCPQITGSMARLQTELADLADLRLVSLTVDPEHDTPQKLDAYANTFAADPARWWFLTGPREQVDDFVRSQLHQAVEENKGPDRTPGNKMLHSNMLVLVDRDGEIRGYFSGIEAEGVEALAAAARQLHR